MKPNSRGKAGGATPFALERFVPYRLSVLTNIISRTIGRLYGERFGLSIPEWRVMAALGRFAPLSAGEVCQRTAMDKVQVSRAVDRLRRAGLVERAVDAKDRRRSRLRLSAAGRRTHDAIVPMALAAEALLLDGLAPAERRTLDRLLTRLTQRAVAIAPGALDPDAPGPGET
jgi:DNA-binding MarR family transcriptional regulator